MKEYYIQLMQFNAALDVCNEEELDTYAGYLRAAFNKLEMWEKDLLRATCNAEVCDVIM
jgi:hypothetical protein